MKVHVVDADERRDWNALAAHGDAFTLMQSWEWGEFKRALGWRCIRVAVEDDAAVKPTRRPGIRESD